MKVNVNVNNVIVGNQSQIHTGEYNVNELEFIYSKEYDGLLTKAIFKFDDQLKEMPIINNKCYLPSELLESNVNKFILGVYGYELINNELKIRYSPSPTILYKLDGSYIKGAEGSEEITPTQFEQYTYALNKGLNELNVALIDFEQKEKSGYFDGPQGPQGPQGEQGPAGADGTNGTNGTNGTDGTDGFSPIATVTKSGDTATISITDVNGTTTATVSDGITPIISDTEHVIGMWYNKPLYAKILTIPTLANNGEVYASYDSTYIIKSYDVYIENTTSHAKIKLPIPGTNYVSTYLSTNNYRLNVQTSSDRTGFTNNYAIIEYTKTTD